MRLFVTIAFATVLLLVGCAHRFSGTFVFKNSSSKKIWVDATGFDASPPVGVLPPGIQKDASLNPQRLPDIATLSWYEIDRLGTSLTNIPLSSLSMFPGRGRITFEFTPAEVWVVTYDRRH